MHSLQDVNVKRKTSVSRTNKKALRPIIRPRTSVSAPLTRLCAGMLVLITKTWEESQAIFPASIGKTLGCRAFRLFGWGSESSPPTPFRISIGILVLFLIVPVVFSIANYPKWRKRTALMPILDDLSAEAYDPLEAARRLRNLETTRILCPFRHLFTLTTQRKGIRAS